MQHCHFKTLSLRQLSLYYIEMRKVLFIIVFVWGIMSLYAQSLKLNKHFEDSDKKTLIRTPKMGYDIWSCVCSIFQWSYNFRY